MQVWVVDNYEDLCYEAARRIVQRVLLHPECVLALPTGKTPIRLYDTIVKWHRAGIIDLSRTVIFNLDEYYGLPTQHPGTYKRYMDKHLFRYLAVSAAYIPDSEAVDPEAECRRYEETIARYNGIDLAVLGLGVNGHIAFNEPGTPWESVTHVAVLSPETREREARYFDRLENVPVKAITMGIRTIMNAREILLLATGEEKAEAVQRSLLGPVTPDMPASVLQLHPNVTVLLDRAAATHPLLRKDHLYLKIKNSIISEMR